MERKQAELDEKLKKEEEERLARKKRLDEIMARTRGAKSAATTPKKVNKLDFPALVLNFSDSVVFTLRSGNSPKHKGNRQKIFKIFSGGRSRGSSN